MQVLQTLLATYAAFLGDAVPPPEDRRRGGRNSDAALASLTRISGPAAAIANRGPSWLVGKEPVYKAGCIVVIFTGGIDVKRP